MSCDFKEPGWPNYLRLSPFFELVLDLLLELFHGVLPDFDLRFLSDFLFETERLFPAVHYLLIRACRAPWLKYGMSFCLILEKARNSYHFSDSFAQNPFC